MYSAKLRQNAIQHNIRCNRLFSKIALNWFFSLIAINLSKIRSYCDKRDTSVINLLLPATTNGSSSSSSDLSPPLCSFLFPFPVSLEWFPFPLRVAVSRWSMMEVKRAGCPEFLQWLVMLPSAYSVAMMGILVTMRNHTHANVTFPAGAWQRFWRG